MYLHGLFIEALKGAICFNISPWNSQDFKNRFNPFPLIDPLFDLFCFDITLENTKQ